MGSPLYLSHPASLAHDTGSHPERAARLLAIESELARRDGLDLRRVTSSPVTPAAMGAVHPVVHTDALRRLCAAGGGAIDADTIVGPGSWEAALHAAGGATELVDRLLEGDALAGMSAHRPPGHHAAAQRAMGFCLLNSVAIAARHALDAHGLKRVLILDWDVHHGNGTNDIFHSSAEVLYVSIHQSPLYPGTGAPSDTGSREGEGFTVNLPVPAGSGDAAWSSLVEHVAVRVARDYAPELILISAGYDGHRLDPLAGCELSEAGYRAMTASMWRLCAELEVGLGVVLEGGYDLTGLAGSVAATLEVLAAPAPRAPEPVDVHLEAVRAAQRLADRWPGAGLVIG